MITNQCKIKKITKTPFKNLKGSRYANDLRQETLYSIGNEQFKISLHYDGSFSSDESKGGVTLFKWSDQVGWAKIHGIKSGGDISHEKDISENYFTPTYKSLKTISKKFANACKI